MQNHSLKFVIFVLFLFYFCIRNLFTKSLQSWNEREIVVCAQMPNIFLLIERRQFVSAAKMMYRKRQKWPYFLKWHSILVIDMWLIHKKVAKKRRIHTHTQKSKCVTNTTICDLWLLSLMMLTGIFRDHVIA